MEYKAGELELQNIADAISDSTRDQYSGDTTPDHLYQINYNIKRLADAVETLNTVITNKKS
jgi:hypothetical protein